MSNKNTSDKYIVVKGVDGLGSNIGTLVEAIFLAENTGRKLVIDWRDKVYNNINNDNVFPKLFSEPSATPTNIELVNINKLYEDKTPSFLPDIWNKNNIHISLKALLNKSRIDKKKVINFNYKRLLRSEEDVIVLTNKMYIGSRFLPDNKRTEIYQIFKPHPVILNQINEFDTKYFRNRKVLGIHYRHGNGELRNRRNTDLLDEYFNNCENILSRNEKRYDQIAIFVCSDNSDIIKRFEKRFGDRYEILSTNKWYPDPYIGGPIHNNPNCEDLIKAAKDAVIDIWLLSRCYWLIYPHGSWFSITSRHLGNIPQNKVVPINVNFK